MALSNMSFTNDSGTCTLSRIMYYIQHKFAWEGSGSARNTMSISVTGTLQTSEMTAADLDAMKGSNVGVGTLTLPHAVLNNMILKGISYDGGVWRDWGKVTLEFDNDNSGSTAASIGWWGYTLWNPKISITPSKIRRAQDAAFSVDGWQRQQLGHDMLKVTVTGDYVVNSNDAYPSGLVSTLEQRLSSDSATSPSGYPLTFDLSEAIPEALEPTETDIHECMITKGSVRWDVENKIAHMTAEMIAPPQIL